VVDQNTDGSVDGGQLGQPGLSGNSENQSAWRHIGIKGDSPIAVDGAVPPVFAV
jgi:hypothetical protein